MRRKKAVVTGGSHGIGRGIVYCLAEAGYDVVFSYNTDFDSAQHMLETLAGQYPDGIFDCYQAKLTEQGAAVSFFRQAVERLGGLDLMVNNAGVTKLESIFDLTEETMDYLVNLMLRTYVLMMREAATYMANQGTRGNIINISSTRGLSAHPGDAIYGGIKAALNRIVQSVALDVASYGIRANNILPPSALRRRKKPKQTRPIWKRWPICPSAFRWSVMVHRRMWGIWWYSWPRTRLPISPARASPLTVAFPCPAWRRLQLRLRPAAGDG
jgi:glucose 1-dehydrogenase